MTIKMEKSIDTEKNKDENKDQNKDENKEQDNDQDNDQEEIEHQNKKAKKEVGYLLLRIMNKIYTLDNEDIPVSGMLRTLYDTHDDVNEIIAVDCQFDNKLLNYFFQNIRKPGSFDHTITVTITEYIELRKICDYFQISFEDTFVKNLQLHWIY